MTLNYTPPRIDLGEIRKQPEWVSTTATRDSYTYQPLKFTVDEVLKDHLYGIDLEVLQKLIAKHHPELLV